MKMKKIKYIIGLIAVAMIVLTSGCKKDETPLTAQQETALLLKGVWGNAQVIDAPVPGAIGTLNSLILTFETTNDSKPKNFSATGAPEYFPSATTWSWTDDTTINSLVLAGVLPITEIFIDQLSSETLTISFALNDPVNGRVKGIGEYTVSFTKQ